MCNGRVDPDREGLEHIAPDLCVSTAGAGRHMKGMVRMFEQRQGGAPAEPLGERLDQRKFGQGVACPLQKQHGYLHLKKMRGSID